MFDGFQSGESHLAYFGMMTSRDKWFSLIELDLLILRR